MINDINEQIIWAEQLLESWQSDLYYNIVQSSPG